MEVVVPLAYMLLGLVDTVLAQTYLDMAWLVDQDNMDLDKGYTQAHMGYRLDSFVADMETLADIDLLFLLVLFELAVLALIMALLVLFFGNSCFGNGFAGATFLVILALVMASLVLTFLVILALVKTSLVFLFLVIPL